MDKGDTVYLKPTNLFGIQAILEELGQYVQYEDLLKLKKSEGTIIKGSNETCEVEFAGDFLCDYNKMMDGPKSKPAGFCRLILPVFMLEKRTKITGLEL